MTGAAGHAHPIHELRYGSNFPEICPGDVAGASLRAVSTNGPHAVPSRAGAAVPAAALCVLLTACGGAAVGSQLEEHEADRAMQAYGLDLAPAELPSVVLGWQAPPVDCPHAYRLSVDYEPTLRFEEDGSSSMVMGRHPRQPPKHLRSPATASRGPELEKAAMTVPPGPIPPGLMVPAVLFYQGVRAERVGATRDIYLTGEFAGPAAPTAAYMARTWDPMEDALALGWPRLTGRLTAVGERWNGLPVEGKCARSTCVDPKTGGGGPEQHERTCVTSPWHEQLAGLYELDGELYAWIVSRWSDGHGPGQGISTQRRTLVSVEHGRPVWSQTVVDHRFSQPVSSGGFAPVTRTWTLEAIDACPGSLHAAGWERPGELAAEETRLLDRLAHADELRSSSASSWDPEGAQQGANEGPPAPPGDDMRGDARADPPPE